VCRILKTFLGPQELSILRDRGVQLREGTLRSRGEALLPLLLASYIFESLVITQTGANRRPGDEVVSFSYQSGWIFTKPMVEYTIVFLND
jgi:hypothetical protein